MLCWGIDMHRNRQLGNKIICTCLEFCWAISLFDFANLAPYVLPFAVEMTIYMDIVFVRYPLTHYQFWLYLDVFSKGVIITNGFSMFYVFHIFTNKNISFYSNLKNVGS